jgi:hypothetical protein
MAGILTRRSWARARWNGTPPAGSFRLGGAMNMSLRRSGATSRNWNTAGWRTGRTVGWMTLVLACLGGCATATGPAGSTGGRTEEQVVERRGRGVSEDAAEREAGSSSSPLPDARSVHGTIDPATGRRSEESAIDLRLHEPRRLDIQSGRLLQAAEEYQPQSGELPYGFRIQVLAVPDFSTAGAEASRLDERLGGKLPVYVEYIAPYYKVRVGDFKKQEDGQPALAHVRELGYSDAWLVRTTIKGGER